MTAYFKIEIEFDDETSAILEPMLIGGVVRDKRRRIADAGAMLSAVQSGHRRGIIRTQLASVAASQTIGCDESDSVDGTDTITIGATTLDVEASPVDEDDFATGATDITFAANLATAINDHSVAGELYYAVSDGIDTVTVTARTAGLLGNEVALAEVGNGFTLGAAALAGGAEGVMYEDDFGHTR